MGGVAEGVIKTRYWSLKGGLLNVENQGSEGGATAALSVSARLTPEDFRKEVRQGALWRRH